jgi:hypothetical protein
MGDSSALAERRLIRTQMDYLASACIWLHRLPGEVVAFPEHAIDLVNGLPAVARRMAGPERYEELVVWRGLPPLLPADKALGLARQVVESGLKGIEPAVEACCIDPAIGRRRGFNHRPGRWKQG